MSSNYAAGLSATLQGASVPYGYTLTVWRSGQLLSDFRGNPHFLAIALFVAGAAAAFAVLRWLAREARPEITAETGSENPRLFSAVVLQMSAIAAALGTVALVAQIPSGVDWPLGGFLATTAYLGGTAASIARRHGPG